ncbi:MAG: hypothetical protein IJ599_02725 [Alphaproteobacteria bacterium]|nr:hypothetical protein [Alphaproteobacteria bacterium]
MQRFPEISLALVLTVCPVLGEESLFLDDENANRALLLAEGSHSRHQESGEQNYVVSGLLFISNSNWTIWINDVPYFSIGQKNNFSIDEVSESGAIITTPDGRTLNLTVGEGFTTAPE